MPVYLTLASLIISKKVIEQKCKGGVRQFRNNFFNKQGEASQEDDEVFLIASMNSDEYDINRMVAMGLEYDEANQYSNDFVIYQRYHGYLWVVNWMEDNSVFAWHVDTPSVLKNKIKLAGEIVTVNDLDILDEEGYNPFIPLTMKNIDTHPLSIILDRKQ